MHAPVPYGNARVCRTYVNRCAVLPGGGAGGKGQQPPQTLCRTMVRQRGGEQNQAANTSQHHAPEQDVSRPAAGPTALDAKRGARKDKQEHTSSAAAAAAAAAAREEIPAPPFQLQSPSGQDGEAMLTPPQGLVCVHSTVQPQQPSRMHRLDVAAKAGLTATAAPRAPSHATGEPDSTRDYHAVQCQGRHASNGNDGWSVLVDAEPAGNAQPGGEIQQGAKEVTEDELLAVLLEAG
jgi:hypothetical protein